MTDPGRDDGAQGLEVTLFGLGRNQLTERQIGDRTTQPCVLGLELLQTLDWTPFSLPSAFSLPLPAPSSPEPDFRESRSSGRRSAALIERFYRLFFQDY